MPVSDTLIIKAPEKIRNAWSVAMRTFANNRINCEVESMHDYSNTETGCIMSNASPDDLVDLGVEVIPNSVCNVTECLHGVENLQYTLSFKDSDNVTFETLLNNDQVDNTFLSTPKFLLHALHFAETNAAWPTQSNRGLQSILHAFLNDDSYGDVDHLIAVPKKTFTTSLPLRTVAIPQTLKATCNAYELRNNAHQVLQEFAHTQCKYQELHANGVDVGHLVMENLSMKDTHTGYSAMVQLTVFNGERPAKDVLHTAAVSRIATTDSDVYNMHVIHADAHYTLQLRCFPNEGSRKMHLPAYAALHALHNEPCTGVDYKKLMRTTRLQTLHLGFGTTSLVLRSPNTPIIFLMVPCSHSRTIEPVGELLCCERCHCEHCICANSQLPHELSDATTASRLPVVPEHITIAMRVPQVHTEDAFYEGYTEVCQQDAIMRQALFRRSHRDV
jgi:hypothetical protein